MRFCNMAAICCLSCGALMGLALSLIHIFSGGRRKQYARPTINSYMYGNAKALSLIGIMTGDEGCLLYTSRCV